VRRSCVLLASLLFASTTLGSDKPLNSVADLRYGVVLYEYYQDNYFSALSELMVADLQGGIKGHKDNPELIEGGISLSFGMDQKAGAIFNRLLDDQKPLSVRNAAWYYLAKLRYQRGQWQAAGESIEKIQPPIDRALKEELRALTINIAIRRDQLDVAEEQISNVGSKTKAMRNWQPYLNYNLGTAYARKGDHEKAVKQFSVMDGYRFSNDAQFQREQLALYDKAFTAAGYSYFLQQDYTKAIEQFENVRRDSHFSYEALLGYGWAAAKSENYQLALQPWQMLSRRNLVHSATQEALLAIPYAYEQLESPGLALQSYQRAEQTYEKELQRIDRLSQRLNTQSLLASLAINKEESINHSWLIVDETSAVKPELAYLDELFSLNRFQTTVQTIRDLYRLQQQLSLWGEKLEVYSDLLDKRVVGRDDKWALVSDQQFAQEIATLQQQRDVLSATISAAESNNTVLLFLDEDRQELLDFITSAESAIDTLSAAGEDVTEEAQWVARYRGMLLWSANEDFGGRLWAIKKQLEPLNQAIAQSQTLESSVMQVLTTAPDIAPYQQRIIRASELLAQRLGEVDGLLANLDDDLRKQVLDELGLQRQRLNYYLAESRLAIARLFDTQLLEQQP